MSVSALTTLGLIRPARRRGFCPACRLRVATIGGEDVELAPASMMVASILVVAALAWVFMVWSSLGPSTDMAPESFGSFAASWAVMMTAMMAPSAAPLVFEFARGSERRRTWRLATVILVATYLSIWLAFGVAGYAVRSNLPLTWFENGLFGGIALVAAGLYGLTPLKRASEARCRELCALHGPLPFNLTRSALVVGGRYAISCIGTSAGLMVVVLIVGMSSLLWAIIASAVVLVYKLGAAPSARRTWLVSAALVAMGIVHVVTNAAV